MVYRFVINKRYADLFRKIKKHSGESLRTIGKEAKISHAHLNRMIGQFVGEDLLINNNGVKLTHKGEEFLKLLNKIDDMAEKKNSEFRPKEEKGQVNKKKVETKKFEDDNSEKSEETQD